MELRHSRNMVGTSATETKNKRNAREDVLEKLIKRRRRIGSSPRLSEEISRKTANNDSSQLQYFHDWTRRSSGWTAGIRDYVIVGRREQIWAERERGGDLPRSNRSPLGNSGPDTWGSNSPRRPNCRPSWHRPESASLSTTSSSTMCISAVWNTSKVPCSSFPSRARQINRRGTHAPG